MTTEKASLDAERSDTVLEKLKPLIANADLQLPCCVDNYICREGDGNGKWFIFDSSFNDGPPFGEFYNAESDARLVCALLNFAPSLIAALEMVEGRSKDSALEVQSISHQQRRQHQRDFAREVLAVVNGETKGE